MHTDRLQPFRIGVTRDLWRQGDVLAFAPHDLSALEVGGLEWRFLEEDARPLTPDVLSGIDGLYHFSAPVTAASVEGLDRLAVIARHGVGLDFIDLEACTARGIAVTITPGGVTHPMASAAVTLVLALAHRLRERDQALHDGDWGERRFAPTGRGLVGRTLGMIGYGRIGHEVVRLLAPWGMRVVVASRTPRAEPGVEHVGLHDLLAQADVVVIACPLSSETRGMLDARRLGLMKPSATLVNVARGAIVDQRALVEALSEGRLAGAGVDVLDPEPLPADDPLLALSNVIGAPHSLGYTDELLEGCIGGACDALVAVAAGVVPPDLANPAVLEIPAFTEKLAHFATRRGASA